MNYEKAFEILEINVEIIGYNQLTFKYVKKQYHKLALKYHPDKNGNTYESNNKFKKINEAYDFLKREFKNNKYDENDDDFNTDNIYSLNKSIYMTVLKNFIHNALDSKYDELFIKIIGNILNAGKMITSQLFEDLNKETLLNAYSFLSKNKETLHLNDEILEIVRSFVIQKYDNLQIYKLNPNINDLINNNLYKLYIDNELYLVPLWHYENYFDGSNCEIMVICEPELEDGLTIDEDNNIYAEIEISISYDLTKLIMTDSNMIDFNVGDKMFSIPLNKLYIKKEQFYVLKGCGISKAKKDIYDIDEKTDLIVKVILI